MEVILQKLQEEMEAGDVRPKGDVDALLVKVASQYANGRRQVGLYSGFFGLPSLFDRYTKLHVP